MWINYLSVNPNDKLGIKDDPYATIPSTKNVYVTNNFDQSLGRKP